MMLRSAQTLPQSLHATNLPEHSVIRVHISRQPSCRRRTRHFAPPRTAGIRFLAAAEGAASAVDTRKDSQISVSVPSDDLLRNCAFSLMADGKKGQALVIMAATPGSLSEQAGVRAGQRLLAISDTMRPDQMWPIQDRPSLRFVRDALRMRRRMETELTLQPWIAEADLPSPTSDSDEEGAFSMPLARPSTSMMSMDPSTSVDESDNESSSLLDNITDGRNVDGSISKSSNTGQSQVGSSIVGSSSAGDGATIGERLAAKFKQSEEANSELSAVQQRMAKRKSYLEQVGQRSDSSLAVILFASFLLPSLVILGIAAGSGYLEKLYSNSLTLQ